MTANAAPHDDAREVAAAARGMRDELVRIRRHLHAHPELSFQEHETARFVEEELRKLGLQPQRVAGTGVTALIRGAQPGRTLALRADMDALPIQEENPVPYASTRPGVMHACGHDAHTAILLGAAALLARRVAEVSGNVRLIFQPGEETPPGGAPALIRAGVLDDPPVDAILALHQDVSLPVGAVAVSPGPFLASVDLFTLRIRCRGGGSRPELGEDGILIAAQAVTGLQAIPHRMTAPTEPVLIMVGTIHGGVMPSVMADRVEISGSARAASPELRERLPHLIRRVLAGAVAPYPGAAFDLEWSPGYPPVVNDPSLAELVRETASAALGPGRALAAPRLMAGDDMAYFMERVPGAYSLLGVGNPARGITAPAHTSKFDVDEDALPVGAAVLAAAALRYLARG